MIRNKVYVDIDALFDTRYTILSKIIDVDVDSYLTRKSDNFRYIGLRHFNSLYKNRNRNTLFSSASTNMYGAIINSILRKKKLNIDKSISKDITIDVNHYPYLLNDDDKSGLLAHISSFFNNITVNFIYKKKGVWLADDYFDIVSYDGMEVLKVFTTEYKLNSNPLHEVTVTMPALVEDESPVIDFDKLFLGIMDIYKIFLDIQFVDVSNYCNIDIVEEYNNKRV